MSGSTTKVGLGLVSGVGLMALLANPGETLRSIEWAWTFLLRLVHEGPVSLKALVLAALAGWLVMLRLSRLPLGCMSPVASALLAQFAGSAVSFLVIWFLWRDAMGIIVGAIVALATPYTWAAFLIMLEVLPGEWAHRWAAELRGEGRSLLSKDARSDGA